MNLPYHHKHKQHQKTQDDACKKAATLLAKGDYKPHGEQQQQQQSQHHSKQKKETQQQQEQQLQPKRAAADSSALVQEVPKVPTALRRSSAIVCRELCTSCRTRVNALVADQLGEWPDGASVGEDLEFHLFQTSMPDNAVAAVKQKLTQFGIKNKGEASLGQEVSGFLESRFGGAWNVIVGEDFAASVIYGANSFMHCAVGGISFLMFSWQPVKLFDSWNGLNTGRPY